MRTNRKPLHFTILLVAHYLLFLPFCYILLVQLLKDKASLCEKVAALQRRLESQSIAAEHKLQNEIQRIKETALAAEKIRRERWVRENTKKIKVNDTNQMITNEKKTERLCDFLTIFLRKKKLSNFFYNFFSSSCVLHWIAFAFPMCHCLSICVCPFLSHTQFKKKTGAHRQGIGARDK